MLNVQSQQCLKSDANCCVVPGMTYSSCVDLQTDAKNCGMCGKTCTGGLPCLGGVCGQAPQQCGGVICQPLTPNCCNNTTCVNLLSDSLNCGKCGGACPNETPLCSNGQCCASGATSCGGASCVYLASDKANCGKCNNPCAMDDVCMGGSCQPNPCPKGQEQCGGACVNTSTDPRNCGKCGTVCMGSCSGAMCCNPMAPAAATTLAMTAGSPVGLSLLGGALFASDRGVPAILQVDPVKGGAVHAADATTSKDPNFFSDPFLVQAGSMILVDGVNDVWKLPLPAGQGTKIVSDPGVNEKFNRVLGDAQGTYLIGDTQMWSVPVNGQGCPQGTPLCALPFATSLGGRIASAVLAAGVLAYTDGAKAWSVTRAAKPVTTLLVDPSKAVPGAANETVSTLDTDGMTLFMGFSGVRLGGAFLASVNLADGSNPQVLSTNGQGAVNGITHGPKNVYFTTTSEDVIQVPQAGGCSVTLASSQSGVANPVADEAAKKVYFTTLTGVVRANIQ